MKDGLKQHEDNQYDLMLIERLYRDLEAASVHDTDFLELLRRAALRGLKADIDRVSKKVGS